MLKLFKKKYTDGMILIVSIIATNAINFLFNAYLGRTLSFEDFGLVTIINTLWYLALIPCNALYTTVNHRIAYIHGIG